MQEICRKRKRCKISQILKKSDSFCLGSTRYNNYGHRASHFIKKNKNMEILHTYFELSEIMPQVDDPSIFQYIDCGFYKENMEYNDVLLSYKLTELMEKQKTIFLIVDLSGYYVCNEKNKKNNKFENNYEGHSVCMIFQPYDKYLYDVFYINSHGHHSLNESTYELKISSTRTKKIKFDTGVNCRLITNFIQYLRQYLKLYRADINFKPIIKLRYDSSEKHNYYGCNLQNGDWYGVCYIFPLIIWYYFDKYYYQNRMVGDRKTINIPSNYHMLKTKQLNLFVKSCFLDFSTDFDKVLLYGSTNQIDDYIEYKRTNLIKKILYKFVSFITHPNIQKNVC